ncbi:hypothetical protein PIB30_083088 [Stylosanthes scabra]|uniref:RRM domain-containing protein n=1 Tax=Stylosanthes scabra TaxID=79078 RepID=A0ABU6XRR3_9FABA|nr:hypothetical protein [Stylosanthes scabra]
MRENVESGKHCEGSDLAEGRNKGESMGGCAFGVRMEGNVGRNRFRRYGGTESHTIFVDNLPDGVTKRELYKKFSRNGFVNGIFTSRKPRRNAIDPFAFIRFNEYAGAAGAIKSLNGKPWGKNKLFVSLSRFKRNAESNGGVYNRVSWPKQRPRYVQKWVEVKQNAPEVTKVSGNQAAKKVIEDRKEIDAIWYDEQRQRMQRSLLGVCVKPIEFKKVMNFLLDEWEGPGEIECRDVGPYRCLITFSSPEIRDAAIHSQLLHSVFDEVRHHWDILWSLSRRVWIKVMGLPWERIHEWVNVKVDDKVFEVFVKEFGSEVYSVYSHPVSEEDVSVTMEDSKSDSEVQEIPAVAVEAQTTITDPISNWKNSNWKNVVDPLIDVIINSKLNIMQELMHERVFVGHGIEESAVEVFCRKEIYDEGFSLEAKLGVAEPGRNDVDYVDEESLSNETLYLINDFARVRFENSNAERGLVDVQDHLGDGDDYDGSKGAIYIEELLKQAGQFEQDSCDEDLLIEAAEAKKIWRKGGISFDSCDEDEVIARVSGLKVQRKKRAEVRQRRQQHHRRPPSIQGRSMSTRKLISGTKSKLKN